MDEVAAALDAEIARWEASSRDDPEARAVLRAFLGVREILWEVGLRPLTRDGAGARGPSARPAEGIDPHPPRPAESSGSLRRAGSRRIERVTVQRG
jgi:hypothetical protein